MSPANRSTTLSSEDQLDAIEDSLLQEAIKKYGRLLRNVADEIWENPEIRFVEYRAHELLTRTLEDNNFTVTRNYILPTGFRAEFSAHNGAYARDGPNVCFICEYDALPGVGHACGHNLIAESGIAMALLTQHVMMANPSQYPGRITVIGTPGEEGGGGKIFMLDAFNDVDVALMLHPCNIGILNSESVCSSRLYAAYSSTKCEETMHGFLSVNGLIPGSASDAAVSAYSSIQSLRAQLPKLWRIGAVIKDVDGKLGLEITYRTQKIVDMTKLRNRLVECLQAGAKSAGCSLEWRFSDPYAELWPNMILGSMLYSYLKKPGELFQNGITEGYNMVVSTDMGNVSQVVPSIHPMYYIGTTISPHHPDFAKKAKTVEAEISMLDCAQATAHTALRLLRNPHELLAVKREFQNKKNNDA